MKYSININQVALAGSGLDFNDGAILDYLCVLAMSVNSEIARHRLYLKESEDRPHQAYTWVDYTAMLVQMPMLPFKSRSRLSERVAKIKDAGYIVTARSSNGRLYFRLAEKADELFTKKEPDAVPRPVANTQQHRSEYRTAKKEAVRNIEKPVRNIEQGRSENRTYYNTNDYNTKIKEDTSNDVMLVYQHFCKIFKKNPNRYRLSDARIRKLRLRLKDAGKDMLMEAITKCHSDDFYSGRSKRWHGADLDWIIDKYENVEKLANLTPNAKQQYRPPMVPKTTKMPEPIEHTPEEQARIKVKIDEIRQKLRKHVTA